MAHLGPGRFPTLEITYQRLIKRLVSGLLNTGINNLYTMIVIDNILGLYLRITQNILVKIKIIILYLKCYADSNGKIRFYFVL